MLPPDELDLDGDGNTTESIPFDLEANPRIGNGTVDMGAFETTIAAEKLFVNGDSTASDPNGFSWYSAYDNLQDALTRAAVLNTDGNSANDVNQIWIAEGVYTPTGELEPGDARSASFSLVDGVTLCGGFAGTETVFEERDISTYVTTLSGDLGTLGDNSDNAYTVVYCAENLEADLDGIVVSHGNADGAEDTVHRERRRGGGVYSAGALALTNATFTDNLAAVYGGAVYNSGTGSLRIVDSTFSSNRSGDAGGAVHNAGTMAIDDSLFSDNTATNAGGGIANLGCASILESELCGNIGRYGGAIHSDGTLTVESSVLSDNSTSEFGGAAAHLLGTATFVCCDILRNVSDYAGAVFVSSGSTSFEDCVFSENRAAKSTESEWATGGAVCIEEGNVELLRCTVSGNCAELYGGGIFNRGELSVVDSTFEDNASDDCGGGIYNDEDGILTVEDSMINGNDAANGGGGITNFGSVSILESELCNNTATYGGAINSYGTLLVESSLLADNAASTYVGAAARLAGTATFVDCNIVRNVSVGYGAVRNEEGTASFTDCLFSENRSTDSEWGDGAALHNENGTVNLLRCIVLNNSSEHFGGGISNSGEFTITNSAVMGNAAKGSGGGAYNSGTLMIVNSSFVGNSAARGGAIFNTGTLTATSSTLAGNLASEGGGIYSEDGALTLHNSILWLNAGDNLGGSGSMSSAHCLIGVDPKFLRDPSDGGDGWGDDIDTPAIDESENDDYGDLRLGADSPAIDAGDNVHLPPDELDLDDDGDTAEPIPFDLAGIPRIIDSDENGTAIVDIGAYEFDPAAIPGDQNGDLNRDGYVGSADLDIVRANWGRTVVPGSLPDGDPSGDGYVGCADLDIVRGDWGASVPTAATAAATATLRSAHSSSAVPTDRVYGPRRKEEAERNALSDAAMTNWDSAEAAWLDALEALMSKDQQKTNSRRRHNVVDLVIAGMAQ